MWTRQPVVAPSANAPSALASMENAPQGRTEKRPSLLAFLLTGPVAERTARQLLSTVRLDIEHAHLRPRGRRQFGRERRQRQSAARTTSGSSLSSSSASCWKNLPGGFLHDARRRRGLGALDGAAPVAEDIPAGQGNEHRRRSQQRPPSRAEGSGRGSCGGLVRLDDVTERHQVDEQRPPLRIAQRRGELRGIERVRRPGTLK